jgi:hypothetical protein
MFVPVGQGRVLPPYLTLEGMSVVYFLQCKTAAIMSGCVSIYQFNRWRYLRALRCDGISQSQPACLGSEAILVGDHRATTTYRVNVKLAYEHSLLIT